MNYKAKGWFHTKPVNSGIIWHKRWLLNCIHYLIWLPLSHTRQWVWFYHTQVFVSINCAWRIFVLENILAKTLNLPGPLVISSSVYMFQRLITNDRKASLVSVASLSSSILIKTMSEIPLESRWVNNWGMAVDCEKPSDARKWSDWTSHFAFELTKAIRCS